MLTLATPEVEALSGEVISTDMFVFYSMDVSKVWVSIFCV